MLQRVIHNMSVLNIVLTYARKQTNFTATGNLEFSQQKFLVFFSEDFENLIASGHEEISS